MSQIKNVVIAGASGNLGPAILKAVVDSTNFNVTVFKRPASKGDYPAAVKVIDVDYTSVDDLISALQGQDAVVSILNASAGNAQNNLIDAAVKAKVKHFIPSEFGSDLANPNTAALAVFAGKIATNKKLQTISQTSSLSYTLIRNSAFLDWGLKVGFILNAKEGKPTIFNGGDVTFSATNLATVGQAVVGVLLQPEEFANRAVYIKDIDITQNQLLRIAKELFPEQTWEPVHVNTDDLKAQSEEEIREGNIGHMTFVHLISSALFNPAYGGQFHKTDNELLGIKGVTEKELVQLWKSLL